MRLGRGLGKEALPVVFGPGHGEDPFPLYARLRAAGPASQVRLPTGQIVWVVTHYDPVVAMLRDERFTVDRRRLGIQMPRLQRGVMRALALDGDSLISVDDPEHLRLRRLVQKAFTPRTVEKLQELISAVANRLLDAAEQRSEIDLIAAYALPLPLTVIAEMLGVPEAQRHEFGALVSHLFDFSAPRPKIFKMAVAGLRLRGYLNRLIQLKRRHPDDRLISALIEVEEAGDHLSESELGIMVLLLLFAGHETTVNLIGNGMLALFDHPEQLAQLRTQPQLVEQAVEELLRFAPPVEYGVPRHALADIALGGVTIRRGEQAIALLSAANRDESAFVDAERLDITRDRNRQITFGVGLHVCLGAPLARMEGAIAFRALMQRFPHMSLATPRTRIKWWNVVGLRGVSALPVRLRSPA